MGKMPTPVGKNLHSGLGKFPYQVGKNPYSALGKNSLTRGRDWGILSSYFFHPCILTASLKIMKRFSYFHILG